MFLRKASFVLLFLLWASAAFSGEPDSAGGIDIGSFLSGVFSGQMELLDIRSRQEYTLLHAGFGLHIPASELPDRLSELPTGKILVVVCHTHTRSPRVAAFLGQKGFRAVWLQNGLVGLAHFFTSANAEQLGTALGYAEPRKGVQKIIERHRQELQPFTSVVNLTTPSSPSDNRGGGPQQTTIIDTDGQYMIALLANTPKAADFRIFVVGMLKALERREFIPLSQALAWQEEQSRLFDYLALSKSVNLRKYRNFLRYRDMGLSQREIGKLLDVSEFKMSGNKEISGREVDAVQSECPH